MSLPIFDPPVSAAHPGPPTCEGCGTIKGVVASHIAEDYDGGQHFLCESHAQAGEYRYKKIEPIQK